MARVIDVRNPAGQGQHLALAQQLLAQILLEQQRLAGQRTRNFTLLHALGIFELFFAEPQNLPMV